MIPLTPLAHTLALAPGPVDAQTEGALYELSGRPYPWCHPQLTLNPANPPESCQPDTPEEYSCFFFFPLPLFFTRSPSFFYLFVCLFFRAVTSAACAPHTLSEAVGGYFYKGLFPKCTACPITDTLTASHLTHQAASGHWVTVFRMTLFKQHRRIIGFFLPSTWLPSSK